MLNPLIDLLRLETAWPKNGLFSLLFVYFFVRSAATHSKISLNQENPPLFLISSAPAATSLVLHIVIQQCVEYFPCYKYIGVCDAMQFKIHGSCWIINSLK